MAEENTGLHIDTDWKKQAQEEKRRLAEQEQKNKPAAAPVAPAGVVASAPPAAAQGAPSGRVRPGRRDGREMPAASFASLVQSLMTQALLYLGEITARGMAPTVDLDMAKHNIDLLGILEDKTRGNLTDEEKRMLDSILYELRMRFISTASRYAELP